MSAVAELTLRALDEFGCVPLPGYASSLRSACAEHPPPFGMSWYGKNYRMRAIDPVWFAESLIFNAEKEGEGARALWKLAARTPDQHVADQIRAHAVDESRHALLYLAMLETVFPTAVGRELRASLRALSPRFRPDERPAPRRPVARRAVIDALIQMNLGEVRTRIHQLLLEPVIRAYCPIEHGRRLERLLASVMRDETRHIEYTAQLIEGEIERGEAAFVRATMVRRLAEFNTITMAEVGRPTVDRARRQRRKSGGVDRSPKLELN